LNAAGETPGQWRRLRSARTQDGDLGIPSVELPIRLEAGVPRLAVGRLGEALLLIPLAAGAQSPETPESRGLAVREAVLSIRGEPVRFLELACPEVRLEGVFEQVVEEVLRRLAEGETAAEAVADTVAEFRDLLDRPARAITVEALIGLLGELLVLNELLAISPTAWRAWTGPTAGRHDFRAGHSAVECKTSRRAAGGRITISAIDQLEAPAAGKLLLRVLVLEPDAGGALSVARAANAALAAASDATALRERLLSAGWTPDGTDLMGMRFSVLDDAWYQVVDDFPRLTRRSLLDGDLPPGIVGLTYTLQLDAADDFRLDADEATPLLRTIAHAA
jgi:hypothetical protein